MAELQNKVEIHMEHIGMVYPADGKEVTALTDVTLDIRKGEFVSLWAHPDAVRQRFCGSWQICCSLRPV